MTLNWIYATESNFGAETITSTDGETDKVRHPIPP